MTEKINLKKMEKKAWTSYFQDGLTDIFIGCIVLMFALAPLLSESFGDFWSSFIFLPFWALIYLLILLVKKYIITPRIGIVKFSLIRKKKLLTFSIIISIVLSFGFFLGILSFMDFNLPGWIHMARFGLIILIGSILAAYFLDFPHLYLYGSLFVLSLLIGEWLWAHMNVSHHGFPITFGFTASVILLSGLIKFILLIHKNPVQKTRINLKKLEKKAFLDSNQDGLMEIFMGVFFFSIAGYLGTKNFPILLIILATCGPLYIQLIRSRFTYPRIGYAKPSKRLTREILLGVFLYMFVVLFLICIVPFIVGSWDLRFWDQLSLVFFGALTIGVYGYLGFTLGSIRNYILAALSLTGTIVVYAIDFGTVEQSLEMFFLGMSGILLATGLVTFFIFLRKYTLSAKETFNER